MGGCLSLNWVAERVGIALEVGVSAVLVQSGAVMNADGGGQRRLTQNPENALPAWSFRGGTAQGESR
jgi:hypothetical protein